MITVKLFRYNEDKVNFIGSLETFDSDLLKS